MPLPAYNQGIHTALVEATRAGLSARACAGKAGIGVRAVYRWLEKGKRCADAMEEEDGGEWNPDDEKYVALYRDIEKARADREEELLAEIDGEEKAGQWMRQAWKLERRDPENWGPPATRVVHEGTVEHKQMLELPPETQKNLHALLHGVSKPKELTDGS